MVYYNRPSVFSISVCLLVLSRLPAPSLSLSRQSTCSVLMIIDQNSPIDCSTSPSPISNTFNCSQLQDALSIVTSTGLVGQGDPVCVSLTAGEHPLTYTDMQIEYSVHIMGSGDGETVLQCSPSETFNEDKYEEFPLRFGGNTSILVEGVSFGGCGRPLLFNGTANVTIQDSHFSKFTQTALEIYNTASVTITNSTFTDNICKGQGQLRNSGNAGAVSIGYNETYPPETSPLIHIMNCTFTGNEARLPTSECGDTNSALSRKMYVQRGGGIGCYFSAPSLQSEVYVCGCLFQGNTAEDSGGGIYMNLNGRDSAVTNITITDTQFINNTAMYGAGVEITFDTSDSVQNPNHLVLERCHFERNSGFQGGAMKLPQISQEGNLNSIQIIDCRFISNTAQTGAALHIDTFLTGLLIDPVIDTRRINVHSSTFISNTGKRGVTFFSFNHVTFNGTTVFLNNTGPSIRLRGSLASWEGTINFQGNRNHNEGLSGAVYVSSFSQLLLNPGVHISFIENTGLEGAAIVVQTPRISSGFARTLYNPQCFLQFSDPTKAPVEWSSHNVSVYFAGNRALVGPNLFITDLNACSWFNFTDNYFNIDITETWSFVNASTNYVVRRGMEDDSREFYLQTQLQALKLGNSLATTKCSEDGSKDVVCAYPGQFIPVNVKAVDQFNHNTTGFLRISQNKSSSDVRVVFTPSIVQIAADSDNITVQYNFNGSVTTEQMRVNIEAAFSSVNVSTSFLLRPISCPPGFHLHSQMHSCECEHQQDILDCDRAAMKFVLLNDGLWGGPRSWSRTLVTYPCPPQYCNCTGSPNDNTIEGCALIYSNPSLSCTANRAGILCGECVEPYGVGMLSMECRQFTAQVNMYYWLIPLLVLFVVVAVVIIVKLGVAIPYFLLGFLFYIQVSSVAVASFSQPFRLNSYVMNYLSNFLSLYVPYDFSLHSRLSALEAYGLRYISPLLALLVAPIAAAIKFHPRSWNGIWTLLLLMYGMVTETSSSLLFCPTFTRTTTKIETTTVWFYDGSVSCFEGAHLGLALLSIFFLPFLTLLIPITTVIAYHRELSAKFRVLDRRSLEKMSLCLTSPYHPHSRWWLSLELARRLVFIMSVIFCPGYVSLPLLEAGLLLMLIWFVQPYKDWKANVSEAFSVCLLVVLLCLGNTNPLVDLGKESRVILWPLFYLPLAIAVVTSFIYAGWKCRPVWRALVRVRSGREEGERRSDRQFTEILTRKKTVRTTVRTTEVGFENAEDLELSDL